jgi:hypothetical protein
MANEDDYSALVEDSICFDIVRSYIIAFTLLIA